ncbi:MAG: ABC transporter ATP-binding protein [Proteobacteria bacterium]|nr:ABC transporter ATP-binding protein [Pseudomonadota bacterium]
MTENNLLQIKNLSMGFHTESGFSPVLDEVCLEIARGETVALVGESGSGKSVTALSILQLLERETVQSSGEIIFETKDMLKLPEAQLRKIRGNRIAMIFQEPMTSLNPVYSIGNQLIEPLMLHQGLDKDTARSRAIELLKTTGISNPEDRINNYPHQLSGGQRQRVMIAIALACHPVLLIADEPTTALDVTIQAQILALIRDIQQEMNMAVLLITHDLNMVKKFARRLYIMHQGKIVEHGMTKDIFSSPKAPYTIHLLNSVPSGEPAPKPASAPILTINNLQCSFSLKAGFFKRQVGEIRAVDQVSITIRQGTTYGIVGESGSGKSTLGMCILRLTGCNGEILYNDENLLSLTNRQMRPIRKEFQVVFQDPFASLSPRLTVEQIIAEGLQVHKPELSKEQRRKSVEAALTEVGLEQDMAQRYPHEFSGGQRQRIAIARAMILKPKFLILDEPTSALDMTIQAQIIDLLRDFQKKYGMTYLFISHDLRVIRAMADDIAVMQNGRIVESGQAAEIFRNPQHPYTRQLFSAAFNLDIITP